MGSKDIKEKSNKKRKSTHSKGKSEKVMYSPKGRMNLNLCRRHTTPIHY